MTGQKRIIAVIGATALVVGISTGALVAQRGIAYQAASVADLGVQEAVKFAFNTQKEKEGGMILFSSLVSAESATIPTGVSYRLCMSVGRGQPLERALAIVQRDAKWQWSMVSWTYENCEAPRAAAQPDPR